MKKKHFLPILYTFAILYSPFIQQPVPAQVPSPPEWPRFVASAENPQIRDTFLRQSFSNTSHDNWTYTVSGPAEPFDASAEGILHQQDNRSLRLKPGCRVRFGALDITHHTDVRINIPFAARRLMPGENLLLSARRTSGSLNRYPAFTVTTASYGGDYPPDNPGHPQFLQITGDPTSLEVEIATAAHSDEGFYAIDQLYAHGSTTEYSLFTGTGNWLNDAHWSNAPAFRHRKALINGAVTIDTIVTCEEIHIGSGHLSVSPNGRLYTYRLTLHLPTTNDAPSEKAYPALSGDGKVEIAEECRIRKTFAEKGKWYFVAFPFDVYPEGIDPAFRLGDETPNEGGNYLYVQTYNHRQRAQSGLATNNWETIPSSRMETEEILLRKNKGYLIALDERASSATVCFSSRKGEKTVFTDQEYRIPVETAHAAGGADDPDSGWYLCGNPLPGTLSLTQIVPNPSTDGNIYVYDGTAYHAYAIGSEGILPPAAAFFIKAKQETELQIFPQQVRRPESPMIRCAALSSTTKKEPERMAPTLSSTGQAPHRIDWAIRENRLYLAGLPAPGTVFVRNIQGRLLYQTKVPEGRSVHFLPLPTGIYVLTIEDLPYRSVYKCRIER